MKLAIISHTEHYLNKDGEIVGWGPTITEINHLIEKFDKIYHVAFLHKTVAPPSSIAYTSKNIEFVALPPSGGKNLLDKTTVITNLPKTISIINDVLDKVDAFQFRAPVGIGVYLIPYLTRFSTKKGWFKYAGNWNQENPPLGYKIQRKFLKNQNKKVTINGNWPDQPAHCLTFENPCLTIEERKEGLEIIRNKTYLPKFTFCFVGRLEDEKGVQRILDAFGKLKNKDLVKKIHFIGNGKKLDHYKKESERLNIPTMFHGFLTRKEVFKVYKEASFLLLPSTASEGFPKVIAEGMNYGCIPIVSNVSSIGQYITTKNGYVINPITAEKLHMILDSIFSENPEILMDKAEYGHKTAANFTFEYYNNRIINEILT